MVMGLTPEQRGTLEQRVNEQLVVAFIARPLRARQEMETASGAPLSQPKGKVASRSPLSGLLWY
jgi:hypothetical protein